MLTLETFQTSGNAVFWVSFESVGLFCESTVVKDDFAFRIQEGMMWHTIFSPRPASYFELKPLINICLRQRAQHAKERRRSSVRRRASHYCSRSIEEKKW